MKKLIKFLAILISALVVLYILYFVGTGFTERYDVYLHNYSVSGDVTQLTFSTGIYSSMGFTRGFKDNGGGGKPHYLTFYSTFGGLNSTLGAKDEFVLSLHEKDSEIYFADIGGGYKLVLKKNPETGVWEEPKNIP